MFHTVQNAQDKFRKDSCNSAIPVHTQDSDFDTFSFFLIRKAKFDTLSLETLNISYQAELRNTGHRFNQ